MDEGRPSPVFADAAGVGMPRGERLYFWGFLTLATLLIALALYFTQQRTWVGDFWIHTAIVRELSVRPLAPSHPLVVGEPALIPYWPYSVVVATGARLAGVAAYRALAAMAIVNLLLLLVGLRSLTRRLHASEATPLFATALFLLLWGEHPWLISGFLHLEVFFYVLSYPSTFTIALTFFALAKYDHYLATRHGKAFAQTLLLALAVTLVHALTAIFLFAGLAAMIWSKHGVGRLRPYLDGAVIVAVSCSLAAVWPYFPLLDATGSSHYAADPAAIVMYQFVLGRIGPALLGLLSLLAALRRDRRDPLAATFALVTLVYAYGYWSGEWSYGRVLPYAVMVLQLSLARDLARVTRRLGGAGAIIATLIACVLCLRGSIANYTGIDQASGPDTSVREKRHDPVSRFGFLPDYVPADAVVLSDFLTSMIVPAFSGKVVVFNRPSFFAGNFRRRRQDLRTFFAAETSKAQRGEIILRYKAEFLLVDPGLMGFGPYRLNTFKELGRVEYEQGGLMLVRLYLPQPQPDTEKN